MKKMIIPFILLLISCQCGLLAPDPTRVPAAPVTTPRAIKELPAPVPQTHLSMKEAWLKSKPEVRAWAADAQVGVNWECQGALTEDGYCNHWRGRVGSASRQEMGELRVTKGEVKFRPLDTHKNIVEEVLAAPFDPEEFLDSPAVVQRALAWLAAEGLIEERTRIEGISLRSHLNELEACGLSSGPAIYMLWTDNPSGRLCLDPYSGSVVFDDMR